MLNKWLEDVTIRNKLQEKDAPLSQKQNGDF